MFAPSKPTTTEARGKDEHESPRYQPEMHPATETVCALVKESARQPKDLDPEGRLGVEGLVNQHDLHTPPGKALSDYLFGLPLWTTTSDFLDPLFAALGIDLDLALRHFAAMMKDSTT